MPEGIEGIGEAARRAGDVSSKKPVKIRSPRVAISPTAWMSTFRNDIGDDSRLIIPVTTPTSTTQRHINVPHLDNLTAR